MKRILHIIPSLTSGGAERQLATVICNTNADEFTHCVYSLGGSEFFAPVLREAGHAVEQLSLGKHPWFSATSQLLPFVRRYQPHLITTWLYDANIVGRLLRLRNFNIPLLTSLHTLEYEPEIIRASGWSPYKVEVLRQIDKLTKRLANPYFQACSYSVKESNQRRLKIPDSRIEVIYNGIDPKSLDASFSEANFLRQKLEIPADAFVYTTVGRVDAMKNQALVLRAFPEVLKNVPQAYLTIIGSGRLEQYLKDSANALDINHRVRFLGQRKDVGACLEMADAFVFPTLTEGHPMALVEAMFKRLPCVASDLDVIKEVVVDGQNGLLFETGNAGRLAAAMIKLFGDPNLRRTISERGFRDVEKRFHIRSIAREWENLYTRLIDEARKN